MSPLIVGSIGVGMLLLAFILNLLRVLSEQSLVYLLMNFLGAGLACVYAWQSGSIPFVILEAVWGLTALAKLISTMTPKNPKGPETKNPRLAGG